MKKKTKTVLKRLIITISVLILLTLFFLYSLWWPSSQVFWKTTYKNSGSHISLTFDDGPGLETPLIFSTLQENNVTATFFVVCSQINENEKGLIKNMSGSGMEIGLHGASHVIGENYTTLKACKEMLENITGKPVLYYRPPYGFKAPRTMKAARELNMTIVLWSVFPRDYKAKSSDIIISRVEHRLFPGAIICMHDGPENRARTALALQEIISYAKEKEYTIGSLPENKIY
jgi:peptidoglycan-N-acetylglucosamine deacetylase